LSESSCHAPSLAVAVTGGAPCVILCDHRGCILLVIGWRRRVKGVCFPLYARTHILTQKKKFTPAFRVVVVTKEGCYKRIGLLIISKKLVPERIGVLIIFNRFVPKRIGLFIIFNRWVPVEMKEYKF
jgi:hypothetical protein